MATVVASGGQAVMIIGLSVSGCSPILAVVFMVLGTSVTGALSSATIANYVDLSPNYASVLFGISGLITNAAGIISPMIVGILTNNNVRIVYNMDNNIAKNSSFKNVDFIQFS